MTRRPARTASAARAATVGVDEVEGRASRRDVVQQRRDVDHRVVVEGDVARVILPQRKELRPAAVGILRGEQVVDAASAPRRDDGRSPGTCESSRIWVVVAPLSIVASGVAGAGAGRRGQSCRCPSASRRTRADSGGRCRRRRAPRRRVPGRRLLEDVLPWTLRRGLGAYVRATAAEAISTMAANCGYAPSTSTPGTCNRCDRDVDLHRWPFWRRRKHFDAVLVQQAGLFDLGAGNRRIPGERLGARIVSVGLRMRHPFARAVRDDTALVMGALLARRSRLRHSAAAAAWNRSAPVAPGTEPVNRAAKTSAAHRCGVRAHRRGAW